MNKSFALVAVLSLFASVTAADAAPITVSFAALPFSGTANGEVTGNEFLSQGLDLNVVGGSTFNVGCGPARCLGADLASVNDFTGVIEGLFVDASLNAATVTSLNIDYSNPSAFGGTITTLFDANGSLITTIIGTDVSYAGGPVARFRTDLGFDGMYSVAYDGLQTTNAAPVPEPASLLLLGGGLAGIAAKVRKRRKQQVQ